jgi:hypothetical protein
LTDTTSSHGSGDRKLRTFNHRQVPYVGNAVPYLYAVCRRNMKGMSMPEISAEKDRASWLAGQRVTRKDSDELGTVVKINGSIKVKWDSGRTSYFRRGEPANVRRSDRTGN